MRQVAQKLNIKEHEVMEVSTQTKKIIAGPVDIEGHRGIDGRHYILDTGSPLPDYQINFSFTPCSLISSLALG